MGAPTGCGHMAWGEVSGYGGCMALAEHLLYVATWHEELPLGVV